ncbi:hypothetical protein Acsp04_59170 [Actinomadura sp. NBRC 104425]|nr:hypothetical protein Acsp04_59170 [Actinomadura sp. NBRC 104425]
MRAGASGTRTSSDGLGRGNRRGRPDAAAGDEKDGGCRDRRERTGERIIKVPDGAARPPAGAPPVAVHARTDEHGRGRIL